MLRENWKKVVAVKDRFQCKNGQFFVISTNGTLTRR